MIVTLSIKFSGCCSWKGKPITILNIIASVFNCLHVFQSVLFVSVQSSYFIYSIECSLCNIFGNEFECMLIIFPV